MPVVSKRTYARLRELWLYVSDSGLN